MVYANLAQLVEQLIRNEQAIGSSPIVGSKIEITQIIAIEKVLKQSRWSALFFLLLRT